jgi:hypothetical protein
MGLFTKTTKQETVVSPVKTFAEQLGNIKSAFRTAYDKAAKLNAEIEADIQAKTASIEALQAKLAESEAAKNDTTKFMKNLEKFI